MKTMMKKGKGLLALITVIAILAASVFTGAIVSSTALSCGGTIVEKWDQPSDGSWTGWYDATYEDGDGTEANPYIITSAEELAQLCRYGCEAGVYYSTSHLNCKTKRILYTSLSSS